MSNRLNIYPTPPQVERKALADCRRASIKAALPRSKIRNPSFGRISEPLVLGYVYAEGKPADTPYMRGKPIGSVTRGEIAKLWTYCRIRTPARPENPYKAGDTVVVSDYSYTDISGNVIEVRGAVRKVSGRFCVVAFEMAHKEHQQSMSYTRLRPG